MRDRQVFVIFCYFSGKSLVEETLERQFETITYLTARCEFLTQLLNGVPEPSNAVSVRQNVSQADLSTSLDTSLLITE